MNSEQVSVVIVESQPLMRTALSKAISSEGMNVIAEVPQSQDAMQVASLLSPNLILFSVEHPSRCDMQRITLLRREVPASLIVALVTGEDREQSQLALNHGAHMVLSKSAHRNEILRALKQISQKHKSL